MKPAAILIAEDENLLRETLAAFLTREGFAVTAVPDGAAARAALESGRYDLLLTDVQMPGLSGLELVRALPQLAPETIAVVITGFGTIATAVEVMKLGAVDYLTKPLINQELLLVITTALEHRRQGRALSLARYQLEQCAPATAFLGETPAIKRLREQFGPVAASDATVLLTGESGTGKEVAARELHRLSPRRDQPLVALNCASFAGDLLENELFGHDRGAFTGAEADKPGLLELAEGGAVFLDEIGEMGLELQARLLRVLEEKTFRRVGGTKSLAADVRFLAATNRDLAAAVQAKQFRADLYYRLNVVALALPPLRERREDISLLAESFLGQLRSRYARPRVALAAAAMEKLARYDWPGNVRELQNLLERAFILCRDETIGVDAILLPGVGGAVPAPEAAYDTTRPFKELRQELVDEFERGYLTRLLRECHGNISEAARRAELSRIALREKLEKFGIPAKPA